MTELKTVLSTTAVVATLSVAPKLITLIKDIVVAASFGASNALDIYLISLALMTIPVTIIATSLQATLIPELTKKEPISASRLTGSTLKLTLILLFIILPIWLILLPYIFNVLYPSNTAKNHSTILSACYWLIPYYLMNGFNLIAYGAIQAEKIFWPNALFPSLIPITIIVSLFLTKNNDIETLTIGTSIGSTLEGITLIFILKRKRLFSSQKSDKNSFYSVIKNAKPLIAGATISAFSPFVDQLLAFRLGEGAVSILNYGFKIPAALAAIITISISIVILPHFSQLANEKKWKEFRALFTQLTLVVIITGLIPIITSYLYSEPVIESAFQRGNFSSYDTVKVAEVMSVYFFQIMFMSVVVIAMKLLTAIAETSIITVIFSTQLIISAILSYWLSTFFGVYGIALGSTLAYGISSLTFFIITSKKIQLLSHLNLRI